MTKVLQRHPLLFLLAAVTFSSIVLYAVIVVFHAALPFQQTIYDNGAFHFLPDHRGEGGPFVFLRALGQFDAQWYLRIAAASYPAHPSVTSMADKTTMDGLTYAFFPLYPMLVATANVLIRDVELAAFIVSNLLIIANVFSLYFVIQKLFNPALAIKTTLLLFLFPFSIFFRSYFAEGLQLLLLVWFAYFLMQKKFLPCAVFLGLLNVVKGNCLLLNVLFAVYLAQQFLGHKIKLWHGLLCLVIAVVPLTLWVFFNYVQTGDPLYFHTVYQAWDDRPFYLFPLINLSSMVQLFSLPFHEVYASFVDAFVAIFTFVLLVLSRRHLPPILWWISLLLWLTPFISHSLMSFSRYQSVSFPLFLFVALLTRNNKVFAPIAVILSGLLLVTSLYFVNWYWVG